MALARYGRNGLPMATTTDRQSEARERLEAAVRTLSTSEGWARWLETKSKFHTYSFGNTMLIAMQRPDATRVAGFRKWQELGRQVRKGERGIAILAPLVVRKRDAEDDEDERAVFFKTVHVFDIAQTDGEDLPEPCRALTEGGSQEDFMRLRDHALAEGLTVDTDDLTGPNGYIDRSARRIVLGSHVFQTGTPAMRTKTLTHELAHWHDLGPDHDTGSRDEAEIVAESVAYVVGHALGLDTSDYSAGYVLTWAGGDVDRLRELADRIDKTARPMLAALEVETDIGAA
jgi:antirestriction protein ArdC